MTPRSAGWRFPAWLWILLPPAATLAPPLAAAYLAPHWLDQPELRQLLLAAAIVLGLGATILTIARLGRPWRVLAKSVRAQQAGRYEISSPGHWPGVGGELSQLINGLVRQLLTMRDTSQARFDRSTRTLRNELENLRLANRELEAAIEEAHAAARSKTDLLSSMSHELRTPLTAIMGFADLLQKTPLNREQAEYVTTLIKSAQGLLEMINDLLDWSRIEAGKLSLSEVGFSLADCVEDTVTLMAPLAYEKELELTHIIYHDVPARLRGDPVRLQQIMTNLLSNAIKFTDRGEVTLRVMQEREEDERVWLRVNVTDTGCGMSQEQQEKLFEAFRAIQDMREGHRPVPGSGLGLAITRRLAELMGGSVEVSSTPGQGSTFSVIFASSLPPERAQAVIVGESLRGARAWILEPHATACLALVHCLEYWGVALRQFETASALSESLRKPGLEPPEFVILGLRRRDVDDPAIASVLASARGVAPALTLVSAVDAETHEQLLRLGALRSLPKSASRPTLYRELSDLLLGAGHTTATLRPLEGHVVLVAENTAATRRYVCALLETQGAHTLEAANGREAVDLWAQHRPGFVLMDAHMPEMDGAAASREIRARQGSDSRTAIIAVSAHLDEEERQALILAGVDELLAKPFDERQLVRCLSPWLSASRDRVRQETAPSAHEKLATDPELLDLLRQELPAQLQTLEQAYAGGDADAIRASAHTLHGTAAFYRLKSLQQAARRLEERLVQLGGSESARLRDDLSAVRLAVSETMGSIRGNMDPAAEERD